MKRWRLIAGTALVFFLGILAGSVGTELLHRQWVDRFWKDPVARRTLFLKKLTRELDLTAGQREAFEGIVAEVDARMTALKEEGRARFREVLDEGISRMKASLNPEQCERLDRLKAAQEARMKDHRRLLWLR